MLGCKLVLGPVAVCGAITVIIMHVSKAQNQADMYMRSKRNAACDLLGNSRQIFLSG